MDLIQLDPTLMAGVVLRAVGFALMLPRWNGSVGIRLGYRAAVAIALSAMLWPVSEPSLATLPAMDLMAGNFVIGFWLGLSVQVVFMALNWASSTVEFELGLSTVSGEPGQGGPIQQLYQLLGVVVFVSIGGHRALLDSLLSLAPEQVGVDSLIELTVAAVIESCRMAFQLGIPLVATLLSLRLGLGFLSRCLPYFGDPGIVGPIQLGVGVGLVAVAVHLIAPILESHISLVY